MKEKISIVIPCYKSKITIGPIVEKIHRVMENYSGTYEVILVNDGIPDETYAVLCELARQDNRVRAICFSRNFGQHSALMAGYAQVTGDIIVGMDDDGEHDPADLFTLVDKLMEGYDFVCAKHNPINHSPIHVLGSKFNNEMQKQMLGQPDDFYFSSYYAMRRFVADGIICYKRPFPYVNGLILQITRNMTDVEIPLHERQAGSSGYNLRRSINLWLNAFTAFSVKPLRISAWIGGICACAGFVGSVITIVRKLLYPQIAAGWSSMTILLLLIGGILMMMLGLIGEYVGRIYMSINGLPQYVIRSTTDDETKER